MIGFIKYCNDFYQLYDECWSGAIETLNRIKNEHKEHELMDLLEEYFPDDDPTNMPEITHLNDILWFDRDNIYEQLDIEVDE